MCPEKLHEYIWQGIRKEMRGDAIELYIPFYFGNGDDTPLCLMWDKNGVLSDGGRALAELKKRVGTVEPYIEKIRRILNVRGPVELVAGHKLAVRQFQTVIDPCGEYVDYRAAVSRLIAAISLISVIDTVNISDDGEVSV